jgi:hypothetical protein
MRVTSLDESYGHQLVAPRATTVHEHPAWAERCYHLLHAGPGLTLNAGRAVYRFDGRRTGFLGASTGAEQYALRAAEPFEPDDDPDEPRVGALTVEPLRPLEEVRITLDDPGLELAADLSFTARFPPVATDRNRIELDGRVVTDYMNFFQSGVYSGSVKVGGERIEVRDRYGFRDRGWGLRKHEGSPRRGLVAVFMAELESRALYAMLYETASGRRAMTNGWLIDESGVSDVVRGAEHELRFDDGGLLEGGTLAVELESGGSARLSFEVENRLYLSAVGYSADPGAAAAGFDRFDLASAEVVRSLYGQIDNGCRFELDGEEGHGYVETGLGVHAVYNPPEQEDR